MSEKMGAASFIQLHAAFGFGDAVADAVFCQGDDVILGLAGLENWIGCEVVD